MAPLLADLFKDLRHGFRLLARSPMFAIVATSSLALGIGGAAAVFTLVNAVVIRALPVPEPSELFLAQKVEAGNDPSSPRFSWPSFERQRAQLKGRAELAATTNATGMQVALGGASGRANVERGQVQLVSGEYFDVLRQQPQLGRLLTPADNQKVGGHPVVVVSDGFWRRRMGGAPNAVGREIVINGASFTVIGVTEPGFFGTTVAMRHPDAWIPLMMQPIVRYASNLSSFDEADQTQPFPPQIAIEWLNVFARVPHATAPSTLEAALTLLNQQEALQRDSSREDPEARQRIQNTKVQFEPAARGLSNLRRQTTAPLLVLLAMVGVLLAIACGNVASLLLARSTSRQREMAIRLSIGAGRARLVRQLLAESLVLAAIGGGLGLIAARWASDGLLRLMTGGGADVIDFDTSFDWRVIAFALGVSLLTGLIFGLAPALRGTRVPLAETLKQQGRSVGPETRRGFSLGKVLVAAQIAFCLLLLVVAGLFVRSLRSLAASEVGYDRDHVLIARLDLRAAGYEANALGSVYTRVLERVAAIPGVVSTSLSLNGPLGNSARASGIGAVEGYTRRAGERLVTNEEVITPDYFRTVGLRLVQGRLFGPDEVNPKGRSTIINQTMARRFFGNESPLGRRWAYGDTLDEEAFTIVGVVEDARYIELRGDVPNMAYKPSTQVSEHLYSLEIRASGDPAALAPAVRQAIGEVEPRMPLVDIGPLDLRIARQLAQDRMVAQLTSVFGGFALALACLGLYGTISYGVTRRSAELGVRMALGADRGRVLWLVMREALLLVALGMAIGLPLAVLASRSMASLLYGGRALDTVAYGSAGLLLLAVAALAAYLPARRASRIDPMLALRMD